MMKGKRNEGENRRKRVKKTIRGRIMTKSDTSGGKKGIFSPNLYGIYVGKYHFGRVGGENTILGGTI